MVQDHIHLSLTLTNAPENAPDTKWKVRSDGRQDIPNVVISPERTLTGVLRKNILRDQSGSEIIFNDFKYIVRVSDYDGLTGPERMSLLKGMLGKFVWLVDNKHGDDGTDHTSDVRRMLLFAVSEIAPQDPLLNTEWATIELQDARL